MTLKITVLLLVEEQNKKGGLPSGHLFSPQPLKRLSEREAPLRRRYRFVDSEY
jgi:hypothetical protein